jgi:hypothetical protein
VDGDGHPDIVFGAWDLRVHAIDRNCRELSGFPYNVDDTEWSSPALYDVDGDGRMEIFIGGDQSPGGISDWSGGEFRALDWANGGVRELWRTRTDDVITSSPAIGDIDGDGRLEAVVGAGDFYHRGDSTKVFAWHIDDGSAVAGWPVNTGAVTYSSPALGDLDGDGRLDVVIGSRDGIVRAYKGNGQLLWAHHTRFNTGPAQFVNASPIIADLNGDGRNDVGVGNDRATEQLDVRPAVVSAKQRREALGHPGDSGENFAPNLRLDQLHCIERREALKLDEPRRRHRRAADGVDQRKIFGQQILADDRAHLRAVACS